MIGQAGAPPLALRLPLTFRGVPYRTSLDTLTGEWSGQPSGWAVASDGVVLSFAMAS